MHDAHQHCPCNGILLCGICHKWAHDNPFQARDEGVIVSKYAVPAEVPISTTYGTVRFDCDGGYVFVKPGVHRLPT